MKKSPKLTAKKRASLKPSQFGLPAKKAYPLDTPRRAASAKGRATQQVKKGKLSKSAAAQIKARANKVLKRSK